MPRGRVATLTLNPAIDVNLGVDIVEPDHKLRTGAAILEPGGGGLNVARVVGELGGTARAVYTAGGHTGDLLEELCEREGLDHVRAPIEGLTRENIIITEEASHRQYRFVLPGPHVKESEVDAAAAALLVGSPAWVVLSGSLPPGLPASIYADLVARSREAGAKVVLDASGEALHHGCHAGVDVVKPNLRELGDAVGRVITTDHEAEDAAHELMDTCGVGAILVSLGPRGALLVADGANERIPAPTVPEVSAVGAGDSVVGALVHALANGASLQEAARRGVVAGAAAVMTPGTQLCRREDVERLMVELGHIAP